LQNARSFCYSALLTEIKAEHYFYHSFELVIEACLHYVCASTPAGFDLGKLQGKERVPVNDVVLPKWASSPEDFIIKHQEALVCMSNILQ